MTDEQRANRNAAMLAELDPVVRPLFKRWLAMVEAAGWRIRCQEAYRSMERQAELFALGLTQRKTGGLHTRRLALDVVDDGKPLVPTPMFMSVLAIKAKECGLSTGLLWDLPRALRVPRQAAIDNGDLETLERLIIAKRGWDPLHCEALPSAA